MPDNFTTIFPTWYQSPLNPPSVIECVVINWLAQELPAPAELIEALAHLAGWRRVDIVRYMANLDWTAAMYEGQPVSLHEQELWRRYNT